MNNAVLALFAFFAVVVVVIEASNFDGREASLPRFRRAINPFTDSIGKRNTGIAAERDLPKRYFDALAGQSLGKRASPIYYLVDE
uniref:Uncharacterized protein n=1 Tax=Ascaris lumbricoides TaxID=6252 RepID=A0A0M3HR69_ASCLU